MTKAVPPVSRMTTSKANTVIKTGQGHEKAYEEKKRNKVDKCDVSAISRVIVWEYLDDEWELVFEVSDKTSNLSEA
jgi:hypothetical protein